MFRQNSDDRKGTGSGSRPAAGPRALGDVLGELFVARGLARLGSIGEIASAWASAVGETDAQRSRVEGLRHGVLTVTVAHPTLLEDLAAFRKHALLASLRAALPHVRLLDLRFRIGPVEDPVADDEPIGPRPPSPRRPRSRG